MDIGNLKHKLRELKRVEISIRKRYYLPVGEKELVWNIFFSTNKNDDSEIKYPLIILSAFGPNARKQVFEEFFYQMYYEIFQYGNISTSSLYDPDLLSELGLSSDASKEDIKSRFRELAKKYHPDRGGSKEDMIRLLEIYERLLK
ncbi:J domain-containing protein [Sporosalibacterium faouarense]|uniref:J domain-containing protein n=1 Tax=Sporosalibacterium faouarense TaxID=516123 RepID=UPI00192C3C68|nr:DnaJ domain-containing protein [Sporosalibacterium faouarense]